MNAFENNIENHKVPSDFDSSAMYISIIPIQIEQGTPDFKT